MSTSDVDPALSAYVATAVADLAQRLAVNPADVSVIAAARVTWPDRALGCPQPGIAYQQVQVDGTRIELLVAATVYVYHSGGSRGPFLCSPP